MIHSLPVRRHTSTHDPGWGEMRTTESPAQIDQPTVQTRMCTHSHCQTHLERRAYLIASWSSVSTSIRWYSHLEYGSGQATHLDTVLAVLFFLNSIDCFFDFPKHKIAMTVVSLPLNQLDRPHRDIPQKTLREVCPSAHGLHEAAQTQSRPATNEQDPMARRLRLLLRLLNRPYHGDLW